MERVELGLGVLGWHPLERQTDRYGTVFLIDGTMDEERLARLEGTLGTLTAEVVDPRTPHHPGDWFHGVYPEMPSRGEQIVLGKGVLFRLPRVGPEFTSRVGLLPADGRETLAASAWDVVRKSVPILMEGTPEGLDPVRVMTAIRNMDGVHAVHDVHVWSLDAEHAALSCYVVVDGQRSVGEMRPFLARLAEQMATEFAIEHTTVQLECRTMLTRKLIAERRMRLARQMISQEKLNEHSRNRMRHICSAVAGSCWRMRNCGFGCRSQPPRAGDRVSANGADFGIPVKTKAIFCEILRDFARFSEPRHDAGANDGPPRAHHPMPSAAGSGGV